MSSSRSPRIDLIAGARPNFMKISSILRALEANDAAKKSLRHRLVHTGQHYDARMSGDFFAQLDIPAPDVNLEVGSGTQAEQTAAIMVRYEELLLRDRSDLCLVVGDVNSTMACAIAAKKVGVPVAHVEAGIRSGDWTMPEEINRVVTDSIADMFFTTSELAGENLRNVGAPAERIFFVGNTMIDTLQANLHKLVQPEFWDGVGLTRGDYVVVTLHRPANVDNLSGFENLVQQIAGCAGDHLVVFPAHPRTAKTLGRITKLPKNLVVVPPQAYLEFVFLVKHSMCVVTDSGGITEETTVLGIPCMTLRDSTERPETVSVGTNELLGTKPSALRPAFERLFAGQWKKGSIPLKWDGHSGERIVTVLQTLLTNKPA
ncbi:MAG: non-hydrolyzing UDP-N-acetylglucosamine 2-epimerase [Gemmatimonadaceae bacterium]